ncbi:hypothetical protein M452_0200510 [Staphylococcus epidermidis APO35]|nr:hypothetical protein M458_04630 [Staphylococcus epidermidis Scl22]ESR04978.1 hypothetical protein M462_0204500 [Staphylococcus epidermidis CIM28]ESR28062.1 hypothetical protein M452_0200510 [Staphylococcus epidermidis APO35]ESU02911.1 hypothetical protein M461_0211405 [Staphylococcus epidermidis CIM37]ESV09716.1 hypothetical protein M456_0208120 [Staphylococcus epidermidis MC28]ESV15803.1 hypothetical protein M463_0204630 [Staphylococcus epidermidis WI05]ESV18945.1 hypothetical protein M46
MKIIIINKKVYVNSAKKELFAHKNSSNLV